jgi:hypothetical protein
MAIEERALHLWNNTKEGSKLRVKDVEDLLAWHKVKKVGDMSKDEKFKAWEEIARKGTVPPKCDRWTDEDEMALIESARMDLGVADTALGRLRARKKADFVRTARKFTPEEWDAMCAARNLDMAADQVDNDETLGAMLVMMLGTKIERKKQCKTFIIRCYYHVHYFIKNGHSRTMYITRHYGSNNHYDTISS